MVQEQGGRVVGCGALLPEQEEKQETPDRVAETARGRSGKALHIKEELGFYFQRKRIQ